MVMVQDYMPTCLLTLRNFCVTMIRNGFVTKLCTGTASKYTEAFVINDVLAVAARGLLVAFRTMQELTISSIKFLVTR